MTFVRNKSSLFWLVVVFFVDIIFIAFVWYRGDNVSTNTGFLVLGALLSMLPFYLIEREKRSLRVKELARVLHVELADLVARCCYDSESPWCHFWAPNANVPPNNVLWLRKFAPHRPLIFPAVAGELALLKGNAPQRLIQFHNGINALRREIEDCANATTQLGAAQINSGQIKAVASRMRLTLEPALNALKALSSKAMVSDAREIEADAIASIDATRAAAAPAGTLQDRIIQLLAMPH
jgi:hypothetical protein